MELCAGAYLSHRCNAMAHFLEQQAAFSANHLVDHALQWLSALIYPARVQLLLLLAKSRSLRTTSSKGAQFSGSSRWTVHRFSGKHRYAASTACAKYKQPCSCYRQSRVHVHYALVLWLNAGMAADPLLHVVVKLQGIEDLLCYVKAATLAVPVFKTCKFKRKCQEGTLQDAIGMDIIEDGASSASGVYFFTPAESIGMSPLSAL